MYRILIPECGELFRLHLLWGPRSRQLAALGEKKGERKYLDVEIVWKCG
jgi:hypothetical protein